MAATELTRTTTDKAPARETLPKLQQTQPGEHASALSVSQRVLAILLVVFWLFLFAGGITVDTEKYRCAISPGGVVALTNEANPGGSAKKPCDASTEEARQALSFSVPAWPVSFGDEYRVVIPWLVVLLFFLPLNLALICTVAGALGAYGNRANLQDDATTPQARDESNPIMSGMLRGFFIYLFLISGLLLLDDKPFSDPGPGQYIRFAGFLSLISFIVSYQPNLFSMLIEWAFQRINTRKDTGMKVAPETQLEARHVERYTQVETATHVAVSGAPIPQNGADGSSHAAQSGTGVDPAR